MGSVWIEPQTLVETLLSLGSPEPIRGVCFENFRNDNRKQLLQREVSRLCRGLPGQGGSPAELGGIRPDREPSLCSGMMRSNALLFWLGEDGRGCRLDSPVSVSGGGMTEFRLVGGSSSSSFSSISGIWVSKSSMRNSGWLMKLWMELRDSGVSRPS